MFISIMGNTCTCFDGPLSLAGYSRKLEPVSMVTTPKKANEQQSDRSDSTDFGKSDGSTRSVGSSLLEDTFERIPNVSRLSFNSDKTFERTSHAIRSDSRPERISHASKSSFNSEDSHW